MFTILVCSILSVVNTEPEEMTTVSQSVRDLANSDMNRLRPFTPDVSCDDPKTTGRHTPLLRVESPWDPAGAFGLEVPEYSWAHVPGDANNNDPFFYGRQIGLIKEWNIRFPSLETPKWKDDGKGRLALDVPLTGGYVQRFRVISRDRVIEVQFGITNGSEEPLRNLRCQICLRSNGVPELAERWPTSTKFYSRGEVVSWDSLGQDLSWLNPYRSNRPSHFNQSCFFLAPTAGHEPRGYPEEERAREDLMWFNRTIDVPAIAKVNTNDDGRAMIVYSPHGRNAFFNVLTPCFHADPHMNGIAPGETRWTSSFLILFEGDLAQFFKRLTELHKAAAREEGYLDTGFVEE